MNKFGVVLGIAAVATLAGCKDPDFKRSGKVPQNEMKEVETTAAPVAHVAPVAVEPTTPKCTCPPGTKHARPCTCGAPDCKCIVETKPVIVADVSRPAEPEYTIYVVQNGDYLAKISKKFNVTISSIKRLNPSIKNDVVRVGQKLKLPGKIDLSSVRSVTAAPVTASAQPAKNPVAKKGFTPYTGATKEYVVKNGDTLGSVAYGNGITIRQLKDLNGLSSDSLKIGQKLKIPAEKIVKAGKKPVAAKAAAAAEKKSVAEKKPVDEKRPVAEKDVAPVEAEKPAESPFAEAEAAALAPATDAAQAATEAAKPAEAVAADATKAAEAVATTTYVVQEGDDITGVSIRWGVSAAEIRELNNLADGDQLVPGQIIKLPADAQQ